MSRSTPSRFRNTPPYLSGLLSRSQEFYMNRKVYPSVAVFAVASSLAFGLAGCGGGGDDNNVFPNPSPSPLASPTSRANPRIDIDWAARSRNVGAPSSALSAVVKLTGLNPGVAGIGAGGDLTLPTVNRNDAPAAYTQNVVSTLQSLLGSTTVTVTFYSDRDGRGDVVGVASKVAFISADGTGIGNVTTANAVRAVAVGEKQKIGIGETKGLTFSAFDASNRLIAVKPGAEFLTVVAGGKLIRANTDGTATGLKIGAPIIRATVDGVRSQSDPKVYITNGNVTAPTVTTASGLKYQDAALGTGTLVGEVTPGGGSPLVTVSYVGTLANGDVFDGGQFQFQINRNQVIRGFNEGVIGMKVGGRRRLVIPPNLGYADNPPSGIPANATLTFDIALDAAAEGPPAGPQF